MTKENDSRKGFYFLVKASEGSRNMYSYKEGILKLEEILPRALVYPEDYGTVSNTACETGEALDGFVITDGSLIPGSFLKVRPVSVIRTESEAIRDDKVIVVPVKDPDFEDAKGPKDLERDTLAEIERFILEMAQWKDRDVEVEGRLDAERAEKLVEHCRKIYKSKNK
ncbi:MAG: inorganic diphosphatase [Candidatus Aenigmatarchaeota archaeon]